MDVSARKSQKAGREKLRREKLNEHFVELGNVLGKTIHFIISLILHDLSNIPPHITCSCLQIQKDPRMTKLPFSLILFSCSKTSLLKSPNSNLSTPL